jgi:hypothetical protein
MVITAGQLDPQRSCHMTLMAYLFYFINSKDLTPRCLRPINSLNRACSIIKIQHGAEFSSFSVIKDDILG